MLSVALSIVADFNKMLIDGACARPACKFSLHVTVATRQC